MIDIQDFSRLSNAMFAAALDPKRWDDVLVLMARAYPGVATHILAYDLGNDRQTGFYAHGYDPDSLESYSAYYAGRNPWAATFASHGTGAVLPSWKMCADEDLERTEFYNDWLVPQGDLIGGGGTVLDKSAGSAFLLGGNIRRKDRDQVEPEWVAFMKMVGPMMQHAWSINLALASGALERHALAGRSGQDAAILVIGKNGRARFANPAANALLSAGGPVGVTPSGRVTLSSGEAQARLQRMLSGGHLANRMSLRHGEQLYDLAFSRFDPDALGDWSLGRLLQITEPSIMLVMTPRVAAQSPVAALSVDLGLTTAEAEVALALADGLSPREIAERRNVSVHTIRSQVKAAMAKCGVRRQTQLAAIALRAMQ